MTRGVYRVVIALAIAASAAATLLGQAMEPASIPRDELVARRDAGKTFFETRWIVRQDGMLTQLPNPASGSRTERGLRFIGNDDKKKSDPLAAMLRGRISRWHEAAPWLGPLLRHPGALLGSTAAERHFAMLGREASNEILRQFLVLPSETTGAAMLRREQLDRELAVRLLQQRGARAARGELRGLAAGGSDLFLRRAAQEALAAFGGGAKPAAQALTDLEVEVPLQAHLWIWLDTTCLRSSVQTTQLVRKHCEETMWRRLLRRGGALSEVKLAGAQFFVDLPEELPFEMARLWGRARIDQCLIAIKPSSSDPNSADPNSAKQNSAKQNSAKQNSANVALAWAAASGCFEPVVLEEYLLSCNVEHTMTDGVLTSRAWWPGFEVEVAADHVVVCSQPKAATQMGKWPPVVAAATTAKSGLAFEVPAGSLLKDMPWLPLGSSQIATAEVSPFSLSITCQLDEAAARDACRRYAKLIDDRGGQRLPEGLAGKWSKVFRESRVTTMQGAGEGSHGVRIDVHGPDLNLWQLWPLLDR